MKVEVERLDDALIIALEGRIDSTSAPHADAEIMRHMEGPMRVILDLDKVDYVSSAGLRIVLLVAKRLGQQKGVLLICGLQPNVHEVFTVSGFMKILSVETDRETALARLRR